MSDAVAKPKLSVFGRVKKFFKELRSEVKKIVWPSRSQVTNNTGVVIAVVLLVGVMIWILDFLFRNGIGLLS